MDIIKDLIAKKNALVKQIEAINIVLDMYNITETTQDIKDIIPTGSVIPISGFPKGESIESQIVWLFANVLKKATKMPDVVKAYKDISGKNTNISMEIRNLKKDNKLIKVTYNKYNNSTFWGLPEWADDEDYKPEYISDNDKPSVIKHIHKE